MSFERKERPERIAAASRALGAELSTRVAVYADSLSNALAQELELVAWDREQLVGQLQVRLADLRNRRFRDYGGAPVRVVERRSLPLEAIDLAWLHLRRGRQVHLEFEPGACGAAIDLMRGMARLLEDAVGRVVLTVAREPWHAAPTRVPAASSPGIKRYDTSNPTQWPVVGPFVGGRRVAVIEAEADRELAAYVLARTSLRRTGTDPRAVKFAYVVGTAERLQRHLHRLWVGARMGPASAPDSFAGPVDTACRDAFLEAHAAWSKHPETEVLCGGGLLERAGDSRIYLAPSSFAVSWPVPDLPVAGPMLVVVRCTSEQARAGAESALREHGQVVAIGVRSGTYDGAVAPQADVDHSRRAVRYIRGALLVERLPPGLPEPRPV